MHETCLIIINDPGMRPGPESHLFQRPHSNFDSCPPSLYPYHWYSDIHGAVITSENGGDKAMYTIHGNQGVPNPRMLSVVPI